MYRRADLTRKVCQHYQPIIDGELSPNPKKDLIASQDLAPARVPKWRRKISALIAGTLGLLSDSGVDSSNMTNGVLGAASLVASLAH